MIMKLVRIRKSWLGLQNILLKIYFYEFIKNNTIYSILFRNLVDFLNYSKIIWYFL